MTDYQKRVKKYYLADKKARRRIKSCKYCSWSEGNSVPYCHLKDKGFYWFLRIRAYLCKYYTPE